MRPAKSGDTLLKVHLSWTVRWPPKVIRHTQLPIIHYYGPLIWSKYGPSNPPFLMTKSVISGWSSGSFAYCKFINFTDSFHTVLCSAWALPLYNVLFTPPAKQDKTVLSVVSSVQVWIGRLLWTCSDFKFSVGDSLELSGIQFTPPKWTRHRQDSFVVAVLHGGVN